MQGQQHWQRRRPERIRAAHSLSPAGAAGGRRRRWRVRGNAAVANAGQGTNRYVTPAGRRQQVVTPHRRGHQHQPCPARQREHRVHRACRAVPPGCPQRRAHIVHATQPQQHGQEASRQAPAPAPASPGCMAVVMSGVCGRLTSAGCRRRLHQNRKEVPSKMQPARIPTAAKSACFNPMWFPARYLNPIALLHRRFPGLACRQHGILTGGCAADPQHNTQQLGLGALLTAQTAQLKQKGQHPSATHTTHATRPDAPLMPGAWPRARRRHRTRTRRRPWRAPPPAPPAS